jgi:CBS domain-containing protein
MASPGYFLQRSRSEARVARIVADDQGASARHVHPIAAFRTETEMRVKDVMTPSLIGVPESASLWDALKLMTERGISALVVFDGIGAPVGILSEGDLMRRAEFGAEKKRPRWLEFLLGGSAAREYAQSHGRRVGEIMTRGIYSVEANAEVAEAIDLMLQAKVRRLLVTDDGDSVGMLSRSDLVRALMRSAPAEAAPVSDADIQAAVEAAIAAQNWTPAVGVRVRVEDAIVTLEGAISDDSLRGGLKVLVENVPGVKAVLDRLAWIEPNSGYYVPAQGG